MPKFLSFLKNKKIIIFVFLFFIVASVGLPHIVKAQINNGFSLSTGPTNWGWVNGILNISTLGLSGAGSSVLGDIGTGIFNGMTKVVLFIPLMISAVFADVTSSILMWTLKYIQTTSYTQSPAVIAGWGSVRDLANMVIVLGFVVIGIATALRIKQYEASQLLGKLIIAAILVNFSTLICGIFIDGTNIATNFFFNHVTGGSLGGIVSAANTSTSWAALANKNTVDFPMLAAKLMALMVFNFISFFVLGLYALMLLVRVIALWVLVILSPLAFVCSVFPATNKVWSQWSSNFIQWCIIGIPAGLFYWIAAQMNNNFNQTAMSVDNFFKGSDITKTLTDLINVQMGFYIPAIFLVVGFVVSLQFSAAGAGAIMSFANKNKGKIVAGGLGVLNKAHTATAGKLLGAAGGKMSQWGNSLQNRGGVIGKLGGGALKGGGAVASRFKDLRASAQQTKRDIIGAGEATGALPSGAGAEYRNSTVKEASGRLDNIKDNKQLAKIAEKNNGSESAAAAEILTKRNAFNEINPNMQDAVAANAMKWGVSKETFAKASPTTGTVATDKEATEYWRANEANKLMKSGIPAKDANRVLKNQTPTSGELIQAHNEIRQKRTLENALGINSVTNNDASNDLVATQRKNLAAMGMGSEKIEATIKLYQPTDQEVASRKESLSEERIQKAVEKMSPSKASEMAKEAMTAGVVKHMDANQAANIMRNGSAELVAKFKQAANEHVSTLRAGNATQRQDAKKYIDIMREATRKANK